MSKDEARLALELQTDATLMWRERCMEARAVVAAQREALREAELVARIAITWAPKPNQADLRARLEAALNAEGVSEPADRSEKGALEDAAGSLTSPVDTAPCDGSRDCEATVHLHGCFAEMPWEVRGYVEHGPDGPQAVYHAETPDAYLEKGDRP